MFTVLHLWLCTCDCPVGFPGARHMGRGADPKQGAARLHLHEEDQIPLSAVAVAGERGGAGGAEAVYEPCLASDPVLFLKWAEKLRPPLCVDAVNALRNEGIGGLFGD